MLAGWFQRGQKATASIVPTQLPEFPVAPGPERNYRVAVLTKASFGLEQRLAEPRLTRSVAPTSVVSIAIAGLVSVVTAEEPPIPGRVNLPSARLVLGTNVVPKPAPVLIVSPGELNFGDVAVGTSVKHQFALENTSARIVIGSVETHGPFRSTGPANYLLAPREVKMVTVEFIPQADGAVTGLVVFRGEHGAASFVSGTGIPISNLITQLPPAAPVIPAIVSYGEGTSFQVHWPSEAGRTYQVWYSDDLQRWVRAGEPVVATGDVAAFLDDGNAIQPAPVAVDARFYRVGDSAASIVGFRRIQIAAGDTPFSVPFLRTIAARGAIGAVTSNSVTDLKSTFRPNQFQLGATDSQQTYVLTITSGPQAGRWFVVADNDAQSIRLDEAGGPHDLTKLLHVGDAYVIYPLQSVASLFPPEGAGVHRDDHLFLWDVGAQTYESPLSLEALAPTGRPAWMQDRTVANNLPLFPGEGLLIKRSASTRTELVLSGNVPFFPVLQEITTGNNLIGQPFPVPVGLPQCGLIPSGFMGNLKLAGSDRLYLWHQNQFQGPLWFNTLLGRWMSETNALNPAKLELTPGSAFFIQRNQPRAFELIQRPPHTKGVE